MNDAQARKALNEDLFRKVNEQISGLNRDLRSMRFHVVCECDRLDCEERLPITRPAYEAVRADSRVFLIAPGHQDDKVETVVGREDGFWIVQKNPGEPAEVAEALDTT